MNHSMHAYEVSRLLREVKNLDAETLYQLYGVERLDDGSVVDTTYDQEFPTIQDWVEWSVAQDFDGQGSGGRQSMHGRDYFDDE